MASVEVGRMSSGRGRGAKQFFEGKFRPCFGDSCDTPHPTISGGGVEEGPGEVAREGGGSKSYFCSGGGGSHHVLAQERKQHMNIEKHPENPPIRIRP